VKLGSITLIKGNSGIGKSTLFTAIAFGLYGNVRSVCPTGKPKAKTWVDLSLPYVTIYRQKNPGLLRVTTKDGTFEDQVGQAIITEIFGEYDVWLASSYICQNGRNSFLTSPNTGKMELLHAIAFHQDDPTVYIDRISQAVEKTEKAYETINQTYSDLVDALAGRLEATDMNRPIGTEAELQASLKTLLEEIERGKEHDKVRREEMLRLTWLSEQLQALKCPENVIGEEFLPALLPLLTAFSALPERNVEKINVLKKKLKGLTVTDGAYTPDDLEKTIGQETLYKKNRDVCQTFHLPYNEEAIAAEISRLEDLKEKVKAHDLCQTLRDQVKRLNLPDLPEMPVLPDRTGEETDLEAKLTLYMEEMAKVERDLIDMEQTVKVRETILTCPACSTPLTVDLETGLHVFTSNLETDLPIDQLKRQVEEDKIYLEELKTTLQTFRKEKTTLAKQIMVEKEKHEKSLATYHRQVEAYHQLSRQRGELEDQIRTLEADGISTDLTLVDLERRLRFLSTVEVIDLPVSSQVIRDRLAYDQLNREYLDLTAMDLKIEREEVRLLKEISLLTGISFSQKRDVFLTYDLASVRRTVDEQKKFTILKAEYERRYAELETKIREITVLPDLTAQTAALEDQAAQLRLDLTLGEARQAIWEEQGTLEDLQKEVVQTYKDLHGLKLLKTYALEAECDTLDTMVTEINQTMETVCQHLFDTDISLQLHLLKEVKKGKPSAVKPQVNFTISYKGGEFDRIDQLSGGEGDRASLALTLALHRVTGSPFLLLDESFASLDTDLKEAAVETIRDHATSTVLVIMHDGIEGIYDDTIELTCCPN